MSVCEPEVLTTLHEVVRALADENDTGRVHEALVQGARALLPVAGALTVTVHPQTGELNLEAQAGLDVREVGSLPAAVRRALDERRVLVTDDARLPVPDGEAVRTMSVLPIVREGRTDAALIVAHAPGRRRLSVEEIQLLEILATTAGVALAHASSATSAARRMATLEEHAATLRRVLGAEHRDVLIERALDAATTLLGADRAALFFADDGGVITSMWGRRLSKRYLDAVFETYRGGPGGLLLRTSAPIYIRDMVTDPRARAIHESARAEGIHTGLFLPFQRDNRPIGALALYHDIPWQYPEEDIALVRAFSDQLAVALLNADARDRARSRLTRFEMVGALTRALAATPGSGRVQAGLEALVAAGTPCAWLFRQREDGEVIRVAQAGASPLDQRLPSDAAAAALRDACGVHHPIQGAHRLVAAPLPTTAAKCALVLAPPRLRAREPRAGTTIVEVATDGWDDLAEFVASCAAAVAVAIGPADVPPSIEPVAVRATTQP